MKRLKLLILTFVFLAVRVSSQETFDYRSPDFSKPYKLDEFGLIPTSDIKARLDPFGLILQTNPNLKGVIIGYRSKADPVGKLIRNFHIMRVYLTLNRGLDPKRLVILDGGETSFGFGFQFWVTPPGQMPELLKPTSDTLNDTSIARKFDDYYYAFGDLEYDYWDGDSLKEYTDAVKKESDSIAYVIFYPEYSTYGDENEKPVVRRDSLRKISRIKADIVKNLKAYKLPSTKIKVVNGGYRDNRFVELWILPKGVEPPAATPNAFPKVIRKKRR
jgi:hypothetical protein